MGSGERKKASEALQQQGLYAQSGADVSRQLLQESAPWRTIAGNYYTGIAKGGDDLTRAVAPQINSTTVQYQNALKKIKEMPQGGARDAAIRDVRLGEAGTKANIYSGGVNDAITKLGTMGEAETGVGLSGYGQAGSAYSNIAGQYSQMARDKGQQVSGLAGGLGGIAGLATGGKPGGGGGSSVGRRVSAGSEP